MNRQAFRGHQPTAETTRLGRLGSRGTGPYSRKPRYLPPCRKSPKILRDLWRGRTGSEARPRPGDRGGWAGEGVSQRAREREMNFSLIRSWGASLKLL